MDDASRNESRKNERQRDPKNGWFVRKDCALCVMSQRCGCRKDVKSQTEPCYGVKKEKTGGDSRKEKKTQIGKDGRKIVRLFLS